jgi:hypothetical protein
MGKDPSPGLTVLSVNSRQPPRRRPHPSDEVLPQPAHRLAVAHLRLPPQHVVEQIGARRPPPPHDGLCTLRISKLYFAFGLEIQVTNRRAEDATPASA